MIPEGLAEMLWKAKARGALRAELQAMNPLEFTEYLEKRFGPYFDENGELLHEESRNKQSV